MGRRELIIVSLAAAALLYAAYDKMFSTHSNSRPAGHSLSDTKKDFETRLNELKQIAESRKDDRYIAQQIETPWVSNPFDIPTQIRKELTNKTDTTENAEIFIYSACIVTNKNKVAVINDNEYREGDQLENSAYVLKRISTGSIVIEARDSKTEKEILFTDKGE